MRDRSLEIIPGILEKEWEPIEEKLKKIKTFGKSVHVDIIDGKFVDNITFLDFNKFKPYSDDLLLEAHLMVDDPITYLEPLSKAGFKRFIGHVEKMQDINEFIAQGQLLGEVGLALDGPTDIEIIKDINLEDLDCILIYASEKVGFAGPPMLPERLEKVKALRDKNELPIEVDGGVKDHSLPLAMQAGATRFVATSFIWGSDNPKVAYKNLTNLLG